MRYVSAIEKLLKEHAVFLFDGKTNFLCILRVTDQGGKAQIAISETVDEADVPEDVRASVIRAATPDRPGPS
jgi:hypothetical protein